MNLGIPGFPFEMVVTVIRKPQVSRGKFSLRGLLLLVMFLTTFTWYGLRVFDRYAYTTITQTYYVGDLLPRDSAQLRTELSKFYVGDLLPRDFAQLRTELSKFAELLKSSATHDIWSSRNRSVTPFSPSLSLTVSDSRSGHQQVADWLRKRREEKYGVPVW
jgi:hypothetical protein